MDVKGTHELLGGQSGRGPPDLSEVCAHLSLKDVPKALGRGFRPSRGSTGDGWEGKTDARFAFSVCPSGFRSAGGAEPEPAPDAVRGECEARRGAGRTETVSGHPPRTITCKGSVSFSLRKLSYAGLGLSFHCLPLTEGCLRSCPPWSLDRTTSRAKIVKDK